MTIQSMLNFLKYVTARDKSKWYSFSIMDIFVLILTGVTYFVFDSKSPALCWIFIIGLNIIETFLHKKK